MQKVNSDLIVRLLIMTFVSFIFARYIVPILYNALKGHFNKNPNSLKQDFDIDRFIDNKKNQLSKVPLTKNSNKQDQGDNDFIDKVSEYIKSVDQIEYLKTLIYEIRWGEGNLLTKLKVKINNQLGIDTQLPVLNQRVVDFINDPNTLPLIKKNQKNKISIKDTIYAYIYIYYLNVYHQSDKNFKSLAEKNKTSSKSLLQAFQYLKLNGSLEPLDSDLIEIILSQKSTSSTYNIDFLKKIMEPHQFKLLEFIDKLLSVSVVFDILIPLDKVENLSQALDLLECKNYDDVEDLKKKYKSIVQRRHPDKVAQYKLSTDLQERVNVNFKIIQKAYDLCLESLS